MDEKVMTAEIGRILRKYRRSKKISKEKMSKLAGISEMSIVSLELGQHSANMTTVLKVMKVLGLKFNFYMADEWESLDKDVEYEQGWGMALGKYGYVRDRKKEKLLREEKDRLKAEKLLLSPDGQVEDLGDNVIGDVLDRVEGEKGVVSPGKRVEEDEDLHEDDFFGPGRAIKRSNPHDIDTTGDEAMPVF